MRFLKNDRFINPYNFVSVPLNDTKRGEPVKEEEPLLTGVLHCKLIVKTPLAVPDTKYEELKNKHKVYPFFHYQDGLPAIPASTLRGAIRSVYETVTDSCFSTARTESRITGRSNKAFKPGVLIRDAEGKWELYEAQRYLIKVKEYKNFDLDKGMCCVLEKSMLEQIGFGKKVYFEPAFAGEEEAEYVKEINEKEYSVGRYIKYLDLQEREEHWKEGYLYLGEPFPSKHFESVFCIRPDRTVDVADMERAMEGLEETYAIYKDSKVNRNLGSGDRDHKGYPGYEQALKNGAVPVWYKNQKTDRGNTVYLSLACIGRRAYEKNMGQILRDKSPCTSRKQLCKACALFGMASEEKAGSRIRVTDARVKDWTEEKLEKKVTLRELASPKSSYFPFYTKLPSNISQWSYDQGTQIRGRKYYLHTESDYYKTVEENGRKGKVAAGERNATMDLVKPDTVFCFSVYYDQISGEQLKELIWTLTLGENQEDSSRCYKLGHGKPLGLGSVKILVTEKEERIYDDGYSVEKTPVTQVSRLFDNEEEAPVPYKELLKIVDTNTTVGKKVEYPRVVPDKEMKEKLPRQGQNDTGKNDLASHKWFGKNYKLGADRVQYTLPEAMSDDLTLPSLEVSLQDCCRRNNHGKAPKG